MVRSPLLLRTEADYDIALREIEEFFLREPKHGTPPAQCFNLLAASISRYEAKHWDLKLKKARAAG